LTWLARCYIYNKKAHLAWELYVRLDESIDPISLLELIANDCYKVRRELLSAFNFLLFVF